MNMRGSSAIAIVALIIALPPLATAQSNPREKDLNVRLRTKHYAIGGTVSDARLREYGRLLEFIYAEYERGFSDLLDAPNQKKSRSDDEKANPRNSRPKDNRAGSNANQPAARPKSEKRGKNAAGDPPVSTAGDDHGATAEPGDDGLFPVAIFLNTREYQTQTRQNLGHNAEHTIGMYIPATRMLLIADQGNTRDTQEVLFHEAFHQFLDKYVANPPTWLNEGLATHFGSAVPAGKGVAFTNIPTARWKLAREAIEDKKAIPIEEVVNASAQQFYDKTPIRIDGFDNPTRSLLYYSEAYTLVHMLVNDVEGKKRLQNYIRDLARDDGGRTAEVTARYFDEKTCTALSPHWVKYVKAGPRNR